jgi:4-amino-4-deoxy-L-arabinose transferase-like glycosyltransferase
MDGASLSTSRRSDVFLLGACSALILIVHFCVGNGYGFHRDELQFLEDARHLQWGYVAYPPLTAFLGRIAISLFGVSPQVFRLPAAIGNAAVLILVGLMARELGGGRPAQVLALFATFSMALATSSLMQYTTFDLLSWSLMIFFTARLLRSGEERYWIGVGVAVGIGILSKYSIAFPVISLVAALALLPSQRHHFRSRWFWYGAIAAILIASPNLLWLARHHFITLQMEHFIHARDIREGRTNGYYLEQLKSTLLGFPLAVAGLVSLLRSARFRLLSTFYIGPFLLFAVMRGKGYYLQPAYPILYAAGAVALEHVLASRGKPFRLAIRSVVLAAMLLDTAAIALADLPLRQPGSFGWNWQMKNNHDLADEIGWPEFVAQVAAVRDTLTPEDRRHLAVLAYNYGEAGALSLYGPLYGLPTPISPVNSFHGRGYGPFAPETLIIVGSNLQDQQLNFEQCSVGAKVLIPYNVKNEESVDHPEILVCHRLRQPWPEFWSNAQQFG